MVAFGEPTDAERRGVTPRRPRPLLVGNWKMNRTIPEATRHVSEVVTGLDGLELDVIVLPPALAIPALAALTRGTGIELGAQDAHHADSGSFTGELSVPMLRAAGADVVLLGHSERRAQFGDTDELVNLKVHAVLRHDVRALVCIGETRAEREAGAGPARILEQVERALQNVAPDSVERVMIAYEPVWAVGTAQSLDPLEANATLLRVRELLAALYDAPTAARMRLLYGGGLTPANAAAFIVQPHIDGALVGAATADTATFVALARALAGTQKAAAPRTGDGLLGSA